jgi:signal-transduction protein with cAMP-binding, CBS, and nucleotidyltransferase domain
MGIISTLTSFGAGYLAGAMTGPRAKERLAAGVDRLPEPTKERLPQRLTSAIGDVPADVRPIREVMTADPRTVRSSTSLQDAARVMADDAIGDVIVEDASGRVAGILTDRDLAIRAIAEGLDPTTATVEEAYTPDISALAPTDTVQDAVVQMREKDIRRLPVVEGGKAIGIVSLGDLSIHTEPGSVLSDISAATPDR